jgi:hypothetical protein
MTISATTVISKNENGDIEVQIEHERTIIDRVFGLPAKVERYIHPNEEWLGLSVWRDKETMRFISPDKTLELINLMRDHRKSIKA